MALVLAVEPDQRQAAILTRVIQERIMAELMVVDSRDAAIAALTARVPDVLLLTALLSPRDEDEMVAHLRTLADADHVQTHTIPQLASAGTQTAAPAGSGGLLSKFRRKKEAPPISGCDPGMFAEEVRAFLARAAELKAHAGKALIARAPDAAAPRHQTAAAGPESDEQVPASSAWSSPFEWRRADGGAEAVEARSEAPQTVHPPLVVATPIAVAAEEDEHRREVEARAVRSRAKEPAAEKGRRRAEATAKALAEEQARAAAERERVESEAAAQRERARLEVVAADERVRVAEETRIKVEAAERERVRLEDEAAERSRLEAIAAAERVRARIAEETRIRLAAEAAQRERARLEAAAAEKERARLETIAAAERERARVAEETRIRVAAEAAEQKRLELAAIAAEKERVRLDAVAAAERERVRLEAVAAAERERVRVEAEAAAERERVRLEAVAAAERERARLAEETRIRIVAEAAERERVRLEAVAAAEQERVRVEAVAAAERERVRVEAVAAAEQERVRLEAAERERVRLETEAAAEREQRRIEAVAAERVRARAEREKRVMEAVAAARAADPFAEFRVGPNETPSLLRLMPLAFWARRESSAAERRLPATGLTPAPPAAETPADELRDLMAGLSLPPQVAGVSYARGCRIRRVRVPASTTILRMPGAEPVILSKRALDQVRAGG